MGVSEDAADSAQNSSFSRLQRAKCPKQYFGEGYRATELCGAGPRPLPCPPPAPHWLYYKRVELLSSSHRGPEEQGGP